MKPESIGYTTQLDEIFVEALKQIKNDEDFEIFLNKWNYWLDDASKILHGSDWKWMEPLIAECRKENIVPEDKHIPAMVLLMPERILNVSLVACQFCAPWGCAYIRMKEAGSISY